MIENYERHLPNTTLASVWEELAKVEMVLLAAPGDFTVISFGNRPFSLPFGEISTMH